MIVMIVSLMEILSTVRSVRSPGAGVETANCVRPTREGQNATLWTGGPTVDSARRSSRKPVLCADLTGGSAEGARQHAEHGEVRPDGVVAGDVEHIVVALVGEDEDPGDHG